MQTAEVQNRAMAPTSLAERRERRNASQRQQRIEERERRSTFTLPETGAKLVYLKDFLAAISRSHQWYRVHRAAQTEADKNGAEIKGPRLPQEGRHGTMIVFSRRDAVRYIEAFFGR